MHLLPLPQNKTASRSRPSSGVGTFGDVHGDVYGHVRSDVHGDLRHDVRNVRNAIAALIAAILTISAQAAQAESSVLLDPAPAIARIAAVTFDDSGTAVGESSFTLETLEDGNQKMTVRMAIEGGGQSFSQAIFAPVPEPPLETEKPETNSADRADPPPVSSNPIPGAEVGPEVGAEAAVVAAVTLRREPVEGLRLVEQRSQSTRADGTLLELLVVDHVAGVLTCTPHGADPSQSESLALPQKDRVVNVPMQLFFLPLVRGEVDKVQFQIARCKDGPELFEMTASRGPRKNLEDREVLEVRYGPNFGRAVALLAGRFIPTFSFWFDVKTGEYLGHRMPIHRGGPEVTLVRSDVSPPTLGLSWQ